MPATKLHRPSEAHHSAFHDSRVRQVRGSHVGPLAKRCKRGLQAAHGAEAMGTPLARLIDINPIPCMGASPSETIRGSVQCGRKRGAGSTRAKSGRRWVAVSS